MLKRTILASVMLSAASLSLTACGGNADNQAAVEPDGVPGLTASNARLVLAPVTGNPAAVYFDLSYDGDKTVAVSRAAIEGAETAQMHDVTEWSGKMVMGEMGPFVIHKGEKVSFAPGAKHIMAMNVSPELKPGGTTEITLIVAGGDKISFPAEIRAAGEDR